VRENAETRTRIVKNVFNRWAAGRSQKGSTKCMCARRPSYFQLYTGFVPDVPKPGVYPFPHLGCDQLRPQRRSPGKCDRATAGHPAVTRDCPCRTADTTLSCWRCSPDRMNELAQKASIMAGRLVPLISWALMRYQSYRASKPV
jgi:hypothetical protein